MRARRGPCGWRRGGAAAGDPEGRARPAAAGPPERGQDLDDRGADAPPPGARGLDNERDPAPYLPVDLAANAESLGAHVIRARTISELREALAAAKKIDRTVVIYVEVDRYVAVPSYESWWEVPVAATSEDAGVRDARKSYDKAKQKQRRYL